SLKVYKDIVSKCQNEKTITLQPYVSIEDPRISCISNRFKEK
ncbi:unnamed protein product, partial [marine sediment metagenome]